MNRPASSFTVELRPGALGERLQARLADGEFESLEHLVHSAPLAFEDDPLSENDPAFDAWLDRRLAEVEAGGENAGRSVDDAVAWVKARIGNAADEP